MSLQVWLPLTKDINNYGLTDVTITNYNTTIDNNGKLGKCYSFNGTNSYLDISNLSVQAWPEMSICFWAYTETSLSALFTIRATGGNHQFQMTPTGFKFRDSNHSSLTDIAFTQPTTNTWTHYSIIYNKGSWQVYQNDNLITTQTYNNATLLSVTTLDLHLGRRETSSGSAYFSGKINDFRLYDHALSAKEVKEIAKGLVLHYKLDNYLLDNYFINPNLLLDTNVNGLTKVNASYNRYYESNGSGSYTCTWKAITNPPVKGINYGLQQKVTSVSGFHSVTWYQNGYVSVTANTTYTMSCYVKVISGTDLSFKFQYGKSPYIANTQTLKNDNEWHQYSWTFTPKTASGQAAASGTTRIYCGGLASIGEVLICGWKLEEGDIATPWCETTYTPSSISNVVYDCSGFGNHGTITGTSTIDTTAPRFNSGIAMNCVNSANHIQTNEVFLLPMNEQSVSFWAYTELTKTYVLYIDPQLSFCVNSAGTGIYTSRASAKGFAASAFPVGQWNHVVLTRAGTTHKLYVNGVNVPQNFNTNNNWSHNVQNLYLFNRSSNNNYGANAALCDFRVYATVLTDDDILDLYHTSAAIDKNGNGYAREEIEDSKLTIMKNGQFHNNELIDDDTNTTASITKTDKQLKVNTFYEY